MESSDLNFNIVTGTDLDDERRARHLDRVVAANAATFKGAQDYTNFIIVGGYAAFFALWSGMAKDIPALWRLGSGTCIGLSLILFIGWELFGIRHRMKSGTRFADVLKIEGYPEDFEDRWDKVVAQNGRDSFWYLRIWPWVFAPAVVLGLTGAVMLTVSAAITFLSKITH